MDTAAVPGGRYSDGMARTKPSAEICQQRVTLLENFLHCLGVIDSGDPNSLTYVEAARHVKRNLVAVRQAVSDAGVGVTVMLAPPPALGGLVTRVDPLSMIFNDYYGMSLIPAAAEVVEQAIGVYEHLRDDTGLVTVTQVEGIDIEAALRRALRPCFSTPPANEKAVQDAVENILRALGIEYTREQERAPVGPRAFIPDFVVQSDDLAIEVKLCSAKHPVGEAQEELAADIAAYRTKWKRLLVVVYDCGSIQDPDAFVRANMKHFGVTIIVVKH